MTSLEYYIEQIEQFISALTDDIESGEGTVVTQTKLAVYREVLEHLEEIEQSYNSIKTELKGDMISRQAVLDEAFEVDTKEYGRIDVVGVDVIDALLPVNPQPKTGTWEEDIDNSRRWDKVRFYCSECGRWQTYGKTDYCPSCGARMVEPQESEE